ncbi:unnamed protein product [Caenorhabditis sp. 36 PRJEB53466]|nr:unnamed protein product [Caenorhabditis sp. 36 PRJEB53466]
MSSAVLDNVQTRPIPGALDTSSYKVVHTLGEGAFGEVQLIVNQNNPSVAVAMKKIDVSDKNKEKIDAVRKEYLLQKRLSQIGHDNVIRLIGMRFDNSFYYLFLEYADGGELFDKIEPDVGMPAAVAQFYFRQLMKGLKFIHEIDVIHRDIKPENLLLTSSHVLKISDFGMATLYRHAGEERLLDISCGTIPYAAPEVVVGLGQKYRGPPVDVWSAGVTLVAMLTGELPWKKAAETDVTYLCWIDNSSLEEGPWHKIDVRVLCLLRKMLTNKVDRRATIDQIMNDSWYTHNYGQLEANTGRPLKRRRFENDENVRTIAFTQQPSSGAKRPHLDTPNDKSMLEKQNASFSQPTCTEDLLLTQHIDMSQNNSNLMQRMVVRMTRFCVNIGIRPATQKVVAACEHARFSVRSMGPTPRLLVTYQSVSMMINLYPMKMDNAEKALVMIDFRRSRGDGLQFKRMFMEVRNRMTDTICPDGNDWLADAGYTPQDPKFVLGGTEKHTVSTVI